MKPRAQVGQHHCVRLRISSLSSNHTHGRARHHPWPPVVDLPHSAPERDLGVWFGQVVSLFGQTTLGLTYSLVFAEALLAPAIPSLAARAGGIFLPLAKALCVACGSKPDDGTERKMGAYVMSTMFQTSCITSGAHCGWPRVA